MQIEEQMPKESVMSVEEAIRILSPDITLEALAEIEYYAGFKGEEAIKKAVEQACLVACEAMKNQNKYRWHDLRKDPNDLPSDNNSACTHYMCVHEGHEEDDCYPCYQYDSILESFGYMRDYFDPQTLGYVDSDFKTIEDMKMDKIIAWREIEPFDL